MIKEDIRESHLHMYNWFSINYIEEWENCVGILKKAAREHACTVESLFEACKVLHGGPYMTKRWLRADIKRLKVLSDYGISGAEAGRQLIIYFSVLRIFKEYNRANK